MSDRTGKAIVAENLTKIYRQKHIALNSVDLEVEPGTVLAVLGPNGAGKTTFVKLLLGLQVPTAGRVYVLGKRMSPGAGALRRRMGYLPAEPQFPPQMTAIEYLDFVGKLSGLSHRQRRPRLAALVRAVDLQRASGERIHTYSTGMKARLAIAASLLNDPEVLVWDEPSQGLDPDARRSMLQLMRNLAESKTLLLCSHNLAEVHEVCRRAVILNEGQIVFDGDISDLKGGMRPSIIEVTLVGDKKEIAEATRSIQQFEELESCTLVKNLLTLRIRPEASHATALANALVTLADHHLEMCDLRISSEQTERAIVNLMMKEASRGLTRAYQPKSA